MSVYPNIVPNIKSFWRAPAVPIEINDFTPNATSSSNKIAALGAPIPKFPHIPIFP